MRLSFAGSGTVWERGKGAQVLEVSQHTRVHRLLSGSSLDSLFWNFILYGESAVDLCWQKLWELVLELSFLWRVLLSYTDRNCSHFVLPIIDWQSLRLWFLHSAKGSQGSVLERPGGEWLACARRGSQAYCNWGFHPPLKLKCWFFVPHFPWSNYDASPMHMLQLSNFFALLKVNHTS